MAEENKNKTLVGDDGNTYEVVRRDQLSTSGPLAQRAETWEDKQARTWYRERVLYLNEAVLDRLEAAFPELPYRWAALEAFVPPVANLTVEDYVSWAEKKASDHRQQEQQRANAYRSSYSRGGYQSAPSFMSWQDVWYTDILVARSAIPEPPRGQWDYNTRNLHSVLLDNWASQTGRPKEGWDSAQQLILLNEYLWGEALDFDETFGAYLKRSPEEHSAALQERLSNYVFTEHGTGTRAKLLAFGANRNVASFSRTVQKRSKELLFAQDRAVWELLLKRGPEYKKGKSYQHLQGLLEEIDVELGRSSGLGYHIYSPSELRREYTLLVAEGVLFEGPIYNADRLHGLAMLALQAVPEEKELVKYAKEYSLILGIVRGKLEAMKNASELMLLIAEDQEQEEVRAAAASAGKLTLMQTVGLLMATFYPRTWLRGNSENGPYLLVELLEKSEDLEVLQLLSELLFNVVPAVPTETEWRKTESPFSAPADLVLELTCSPAALRKRASKSYPDVLHKARGYFGVRR